MHILLYVYQPCISKACRAWMRSSRMCCCGAGCCAARTRRSAVCCCRRSAQPWRPSMRWSACACSNAWRGCCCTTTPPQAATAVCLRARQARVPRMCLLMAPHAACLLRTHAPAGRLRGSPVLQMLAILGSPLWHLISLLRVYGPHSPCAAESHSTFAAGVSRTPCGRGCGRAATV